LEFVDAISEVEDRGSEIERSGSEIRVPAVDNDFVCEEYSILAGVLSCINVEFGFVCSVV